MAYRRILASPHVLSLSLASVVARLPVGMGGIAIVIYLHEQTGSFGAAGLAAGAFTLGLGGTGPLLGRLVDRRGARAVDHDAEPDRPGVAAARHRHRGLQLALASVVVGASAGSALAGPLVEAGGWRTGVVLAAALPALGLPLILARRHLLASPAAVELKASA